MTRAAGSGVTGAAVDLEGAGPRDDVLVVGVDEGPVDVEEHGVGAVVRWGSHPPRVAPPV